MSLQISLQPPPAIEDIGGGDWDDSKFLHYTLLQPDGNTMPEALCGAPTPGGKVATEQQKKTLPMCVICVAMCKYDGRCRLPE